MSLAFYYLSGSPFSWKVWLSLEHSGLGYEAKRLRVDAGDLQTPEFLALNPKGKLPVLVAGRLTLSESDAISEYIAELAAERGVKLWPDDRDERALARRFASAATAYVYPGVRRIMEQTLFLREGEPDFDVIAQAKEQVLADLRTLTEGLRGAFAAGGAPTIADYALYPFIALLKRVDAQRPGYDTAAAIPAALLEWARRIEDLPFFEQTIPPHWRGA